MHIMSIEVIHTVPLENHGVQVERKKRMQQGSNTIKRASSKELLALAIPNAKAARLASKMADHKSQAAKAKYKAVRKAYKRAKKAAKKAAKLAQRAQAKVLELKEAAKRKRTVVPKPTAASKVSPATAWARKKVTAPRPHPVSSAAPSEAAASAVRSPPVSPETTQLQPPPVREEP